MKTANSTRIYRAYVSAWILTFIAVVWSGLSLAALRRLSKEDWKLIGPVEWLSVGILVAQVCFVAAALGAWLKRKKENLVFDTQSHRSFVVPFMLGYGLYYLSTWTTGWLSIVIVWIGCASLVVAAVLFVKDIRRQRRLLSARNDASGED